MSFTTAHRWNSLLCPPLGFLFNFALVWLILRRTPKEMRVHSRILLQTCAMDILLLCCQTVGQNVVILESNNVAIFFFDGYFVRLFKPLFSPGVMCALQPLWFFFHHSANFGVSVQFIYRYLVLNRNIQVSLRRYLLLLLPQTVIITVVDLTTLRDIARRLNQFPIEADIEEFFDFEKDEPLYITSILEVKSPSFSELALLALLFILSDAIIVFCGYKMVHFVAAQTALNSRLSKLNKQLSINLILLACLPFILQIGSIVYFSRLLLTGLGIQGIGPMTGFQLYYMLASHWLPVLNPLTSIFINRPYRDAVIGRFGTVAPTNVPN